MADLEDSNVFTVITGKKQHAAPTDYGFCIKVRLGWLGGWFRTRGGDDNDEALESPLLIISALFLNLNHGQPNKGRGEMKELRMLCAEDEQGRTCWMTAFRLFKVFFFFSSTTVKGSGICLLQLWIVLSNQCPPAFCSTGSCCTRITRFHNKEKHYYHTFQHLWWVQLCDVLDIQMFTIISVSMHQKK